MTETRIYLVSTPDSEEMGGERHLIEATSAAQAIRYVVRKKYAAKVPTTKEVAALMNKQIRIESAGSIETETSPSGQ